MQIMPATAAYDWRDEHDAAQAIDAAARYLRDLQEMFAGRLDLILAAYNAGEGAVEAFRGGRALTLPSGKIINPKRIRSSIPPYRETVSYVKNGLAVFKTLAQAKYFSAPASGRRTNHRVEGGRRDIARRHRTGRDAGGAAEGERLRRRRTIERTYRLPEPA